MANDIRKVIVISGKRKCGKDFLSEKLQKRLGERSQIIRISEPIKSEWARRMNLDLKELLGDGPYKETYRKDMILWSDEVRMREYDYFCKEAMRNAHAEIIIVSDIRRKGDLKYFQECYGKKVLTIHLTCPEILRKERGWIYTVGIDDTESECGLDDYEQWDLVIDNNQLNEKQITDLIINRFRL